MLFSSDFKIKKEVLSKMGNNAERFRKNNMEHADMVFGETVGEHFPYEKKDLDDAEEYTRHLMVIPRERWALFINEMSSLMSATHMSDRQKAEAIKHLLIHIEK